MTTSNGDVAAAAVTQAAAADSTVPVVPPVIVNVNDPNQIKHTLDEHAVKYLITRGLDEDQWYSNIKLVLGFSAVAISAVVHFLAPPHPEGMTFLAVGVIVYFALQAAMQAVQYFLPADTILITKQKRLIRIGAPTIIYRPLILTCSLPRYDTTYTMTLGYRYKNTDGATDPPPIRKPLQITDFFDSNGLLLRDRFHTAVASVLDEWQQTEERHGSGGITKADGVVSSNTKVITNGNTNVSATVTNNASTLKQRKKKVAT